MRPACSIRSWPGKRSPLGPTQVFLDTYATQGIRPAIAREARELLSEEAFAGHLVDSRSAILLAEIAGHQVGFAQLAHGRSHPLLPDTSAAELNRLYVQRPFLGRGIGKGLLARAETLARAEGAGHLWLTAWTGNSAVGGLRSEGSTPGRSSGTGPGVKGSAAMSLPFIARFQYLFAQPRSQGAVFLDGLLRYNYRQGIAVEEPRHVAEPFAERSPESHTAAVGWVCRSAE